MLPREPNILNKGGGAGERVETDVAGNFEWASAFGKCFASGYTLGIAHCFSLSRPTVV